jgi:hypothetical protein
MRTIQCVRAGWLAVALSACMLIGGTALAATTTERPGSILIFPKVVTTGTRDTVIQITNTGNMPDDVRCFYLNGQSCFETDFSVSLTRQQPTVWTAAQGRRVNPTDGQKGLDPGLIPPLPQNYAGALVCTEVDTSDAPVVRNQLKGEATIVDHSASSTSNAVSKYNAVAVQGLSGNSDDTLKLDGSEYSACPASLVLNFQRDGGSDPIIEALGNGGRCDAASSNAGDPCNNSGDCPSGTCQTGQSRVLTRVTLLPCLLDIAGLQPTKVAVTLDGRDETEAVFSGSRSFSCWDSFTVDSRVVSPLTPNATMSIRGSVPVVGIAEYFHSDSVANTASAAVNLHTQALCSGGTRNGQPCNRDLECVTPTGSGTCVAAGAATTIDIPPP